MKLSEIIKEIEESDGINEIFLHRNYYTGGLELNVTFDNDIADQILKNSNITTIDQSAYWE